MHNVYKRNYDGNYGKHEHAFFSLTVVNFYVITVPSNRKKKKNLTLSLMSSLIAHGQM